MRHTTAFLLVLLSTVSTRSATASTLRPENTFASAKLTSQEVSQLTPFLEQLAYDTPDSWEAELRAKRIDLGGAPGLVLEGTHLLCGGTGNCQIFVFRKVNDRWISLFKDRSPICEDFTFGPSTTNGITDLRISSNEGADKVHHVTYQFDARFYRSK